jgi:hypothetical protein
MALTIINRLEGFNVSEVYNNEKELCLRYIISKVDETFTAIELQTILHNQVIHTTGLRVVPSETVWQWYNKSVDVD